MLVGVVGTLSFQSVANDGIVVLAFVINMRKGISVSVQNTLSFRIRQQPRLRRWSSFILFHL